MGLLTAILLAEAGVAVRIIDREQRTAARSYACALHPRTLKLLEPLGLAAAVVERGRRLERIAFYDGASRQAEVKLSQLGGSFPFMVVLPQNAFEGLLEERLRKAGVAVNWNFRFSDLQNDASAALATVEELSATGTGYIVPHWEAIVKKSFPLRAQFVVGADGHGSLVRQRLGIDYARVAGPEVFAVYEFEPQEKVEDEVRVLLDAVTTNVLWPLAGSRCRWTFQVVKGEIPAEFPEKERRGVRLAEKMGDERIRRYVEKVAKERAPWFTAGVKEITWCAEVVFEYRVANQFGRNRCWLAGDAAHQTGPVGVQSMNVGMVEAVTLADTLKRILREKAPWDRLESWDREARAEWRRLLGTGGGFKPRSETSPWVRERRDRILPCLPGSHEHLAPLAAQLGLDI